MSGDPGPVRFFYDAALATYELSPSHPFKPVRLDLIRTLLELTGLLHEGEIADVPAAAKGLLERAHDPAYVRAVKTASRDGPSPDSYTFGLGTGDNPIFSGMHDVVLGICAATDAAVDSVARGDAQRAASFAGGLHHAHAAKASGFCIYNDLAVAIMGAVEGHGLRVAYLDLDVHHGDGVQWLFYDDPRVMTISLHESGRYLFPGTGHTYEIGDGEAKGTAVNVPLEPGTGDESYLESFDAVVPAALAAFRPDLIVLQAGADMHFHDPLADLTVTLAGMHESYRRVVALAERWTGGRMVATGGGGYDPYRTVPRAWAGLWAALTERELPDQIPSAWRDRWSEEADVDLPTTMLDQDEPATSGRTDMIRSQNRAVAKRLLGQLRPIWDTWQPKDAA